MSAMALLPAALAGCDDAETTDAPGALGALVTFAPEPVPRMYFSRALYVACHMNQKKASSRALGPVRTLRLLVLLLGIAGAGCDPAPIDRSGAASSP